MSREPKPSSFRTVLAIGLSTVGLLWIALMPVVHMSPRGGGEAIMGFAFALFVIPSALFDGSLFGFTVGMYYAVIAGLLYVGSFAVIFISLGDTVDGSPKRGRGRSLLLAMPGAALALAALLPVAAMAYPRLPVPNFGFFAACAGLLIASLVAWWPAYRDGCRSRPQSQFAPDPPASSEL